MTEANKKFETPIAEDAEQAVLGSLLIDDRALTRINHIIDENDFYYDRHKFIWRAFSELHNEGEDVDVLTLSHALTDAGVLEAVGGAMYLTELTNYVPTAAHVVQYAKTVAKYATLRRIIEAARDVAGMTQKIDDYDELLVKVEERINGVTRRAAQAQNRLELVDLQHEMTKARENREPEGSIKGLSTGLSKVDQMTQGFVPGELMIISGQTSHGKTQLSNNIILNTIRNGHKVMFVTMEMTKQETADRFNMLTDDQDIGEGKVFLNMRSDLAYTDVTKLIERAKEKGCDLVVIDHLHYFSRSVENATQEVSKIVKEFKQAAVLYEMPVILICHVRKMPPKQHPTIEHLRDSSLIAQDADLVLMVWRDESPTAKDPFQVEVTLWKNRNRQKKHRRDYLYAVGMKLEEEDKNTITDKKQAQDWAAETARMLGEKDDNLDDLDGNW